MKKILILILILSCFALPALADKSVGVQEDVKVGLYYGSSAQAVVKLEVDEFLTLPNGFSPYYYVTIYYVYETGGMTIVNSLGQIMCDFEKGQPCLINSSTGKFKIGERSYRNQIEITATEKGLKVVNILPLDQYLYGVLPNEIYPSWPTEAIKASAVASRSFTLSSIAGKHGNDGFDVCTSTHCQVYKGMGTEQPSTNKAIDETSGQVLTYGGKVISAMFSADNGGYCESTENIWTSALPYLKSKPDPYTQPTEWTVTYTAQELEKKLEGKGVGKVKEIVIEERAESGRVIKLTVVGETGSYTVTKTSVRSFFSLKSGMFDVEVSYTERPAAEGATQEFPEQMPVFVFKGKGNGHGAGMSSWGCKNMADLGKTYVEILEFYYEGALLTGQTVQNTSENGL